LTPIDVVFNITSSGNNISTSGGSSPDPSQPGNTLANAVINGILLDIQGSIQLSPGMVNGEIIGGGSTISLASGSQVNGSGSLLVPVPAPAPIALVLAGLVPLGVVGLWPLHRWPEAAAA
jgi:hypothetical protein